MKDICFSCRFYIAIQAGEPGDSQSRMGICKVCQFGLRRTAQDILQTPEPITACDLYKVE